MTGSRTEKIETAARLITHARYLAAFTGAGISTPSGIPDFRSTGKGLWERDDPMQVASATAFYYHPQRFYNWLRPLLSDSYQALPNPAHLALAGLEKKGILKAIITQNIDGLHQRAGSTNVIELHGSLQRFYCSACKVPSLDIDNIAATILAAEIPTCSNCGGIIRPDITLFEEALPATAWQQAESEIKAADLLLVAGSSLEVYPASSLPHEAHRHGCSIIVLNYTSTSIDKHAKVVLHMDVATGLPEILDCINSIS